MLSPLLHDDPVAIGGHRLVARLGHGGMGTVYLARTDAGRTVALKTVHADIAADAAARTRFRLEIDAARIIGGHHGADVVDADPFAPTPWLTTAYVLGPPLDDAVSLCGPLPEATVRALGAALAGALGQLHASDVVHRDLKPSNVMVTAYGPKIIDFGIAHAAGDDRLTRTGSAAGTPAFMSPEQATGQEHTPAGDVFALAGVLLFAATGHGPFGTGQAADLLYRVRYSEPDLTGLPEGLVPLLLQCLGKDPGNRPTTHQLGTRLHAGEGQFADHLPDPLLSDIARRATEVWQHQPVRLPAPADHAVADTVLATGHVSRRRVLSWSGGSALAAAGVGLGAWSWASRSSRDTDGGSSTPPPVTGNPSAVPLPTTAADKRRTWRKPVARGTLTRTPALVGDNVVIATGDGLLALGALSGERRWLANDIRHARHVHSDGRKIHALLPGGTNGHRLSLHTVDPANGRTSLAVSFARFDSPVQEAALLQVTDGHCYLAARAGRPGDDAGKRAKSWSVTAVDLRTGGQRWSAPVPAYDIDSPDDSIASVVAGNHLILCRPAKKGGDLDVRAWDRRTGKSKWETTVSRPRPASGASSASDLLAADSTHVYVGGSRVQAIRVTDGGVGWSFGAGRSSGAYSMPAVGGGVVYAAEQGEGVVALSAGDGKLRWAAKTGAVPDLRVPPVLDSGHMYVMSGSGIRAVGLDDHKEDWSSKPGSPTLAVHADTERLIQFDGSQIFAMRYDYSY